MRDDGGSSDGPGGAATELPALEEGLPKPLAKNRQQENQILEEDALDRKLTELRGHPVVVNQWASWCDPCRAEFPFFRDSAQSHAEDVAFLGIVMRDGRGDAEV